MLTELQLKKLKKMELISYIKTLQLLIDKDTISDTIVSKDLLLGKIDITLTSHAVNNSSSGRRQYGGEEYANVITRFYNNEASPNEIFVQFKSLVPSGYSTTSELQQYNDYSYLVDQQDIITIFDIGFRRWSIKKFRFIDHLEIQYECPIDIHMFD